MDGRKEQVAGGIIPVSPSYSDPRLADTLFLSHPLVELQLLRYNYSFTPAIELSKSRSSSAQMPNVRKRRSFLESATQPEQIKRRRGAGKSDQVLCLCGCLTFVTERTQRTHLNQKGPLWTRFGSSSSCAASSAPNSDNDDDRLGDHNTDEDDDTLSNGDDNPAGDDILPNPDQALNLKFDADDDAPSFDDDLFQPPPNLDPIGDLSQDEESAGDPADLVRGVWGLDKQGEINEQDIEFLRQRRVMQDTDGPYAGNGDGAAEEEEEGEGEEVGEVREEEEVEGIVEREGGEIYDLPEAWNPLGYKDTGVLTARDTLSSAFEFRRMELGESFPLYFGVLI